METSYALSRTHIRRQFHGAAHAQIRGRYSSHRQSPIVPPISIFPLFLCIRNRRDQHADQLVARQILFSHTSNYFRKTVRAKNIALELQWDGRLDATEIDHRTSSKELSGVGEGEEMFRHQIVLTLSVGSA